MSRIIRRTALASVLVPLIAACSSSERSSSPSSTTTVSTSASSPPRARARASASVKPSVGTAVVPTYADAERAFHLGRYEEAASMFQAYTESEPDNAWGHYMLGLSAWKIGDHTRALEAFDAALRLDPSHRKSLLNSARVLLEMGRPQDASTGWIVRSASSPSRPKVSGSPVAHITSWVRWTRRSTRTSARSRSTIATSGR